MKVKVNTRIMTTQANPWKSFGNLTGRSRHMPKPTGSLWIFGLPSHNASSNTVLRLKSKEQPPSFLQLHCCPKSAGRNWYGNLIGARPAVRQTGPMRNNSNDRVIDLLLTQLGESPESITLLGTLAQERWGKLPLRS